jgi:membrane-bound serine protease (ClpP class)
MNSTFAFQAPLNLLSNGGILALSIVMLLVIVFFVIAAVVLITQRNKKAMSGGDMMVGLEGIARTTIDPEGDVFVNSELWRAQSLGEVIEKGEHVVVREVKGLKVIVEKKE